MPRHLLDANVRIGPRAKKEAGARWTLDHVLEDWDAAGIAGGLVGSTLGITYDPMFANRRLLGTLDAHRRRATPCWVVLPALCGEFPEPGDFLREMRDQGVRAVRIEAAAFGVPVLPSVWAPLRDSLHEAQVLLVMGFEQGFETVNRLLEIFTGIPTLLVNGYWGAIRQIVVLMDRHPHLHVEFSLLQANRGLEFFAGRFGASRCLFGTGLPTKAAGAARGFLDWSLLADDAVDAIAGSNLVRLLGGEVLRDVPARMGWEDEISGPVSRGEPLPCLTLDAHCHILHEGLDSAGETPVMLQGGPSGMYALARHMGVDRTAVMSWAGPISLATDWGNEAVRQAIEAYPEHFIGLVTYNPEHDTGERLPEILRTYCEELRWPGLKTFAPLQAIGYDSELLAPFFAYGDRHHLYAVIDPAGDMDDAPITRLADRFPNLGIHLDHCGRSLRYAEWVAALMKRHPNIWAQLNFSNVANGVIEYLVAEVGAGRVLFGTDAPMRDPRPQAAWVVYSRISPADKRRILGENFQRILNQCYSC